MNLLKKVLFGLGGILILLGLVLSIGVAMHPSSQPASSQTDLLKVDEQSSAARLAGAVKIQTITEDDAPIHLEAIHQLHAYLKAQFPNVHQVLKKEVIRDGALLFTWQGSDASLKPALLMAHQDVVPIAPGTESLWTHPPFSGEIADGYIWGRGTWDDKGNLISILEAVEALIKKGFHPKRTLYFAFGDDEEGGAKGGLNGAKQIADTLKQRGVSLDFVLDEGLLVTDHVMKGYEMPLALIGVAEKGYVTLRLSTEAQAGHSSLPVERTAIGALSKALARIQDHPFPMGFTPVVKDLFETLAPESSLLNRVIFSNLWLTGALVKKQMANIPSAAAMLKTTTAFTEFHAGNKENVLPGRADATINFRTLPGVKTQDVIERIRNLVDDPLIQIEVVGSPREETKFASKDSSSYRLLQKTVKEVFPTAIVAPGLLMATTDSYFFTDFTDAVYRFSPVIANSEDLKRFHGTNERIGVHNYAQMIQFYARLFEQSGE